MLASSSQAEDERRGFIDHAAPALSAAYDEVNALGPFRAVQVVRARYPPKEGGLAATGLPTTTATQLGSDTRFPCQLH